MYYSLNNKNNNKINTAPLTLDQLFVGQWRSLFQLPQNSNVPTMPHLALESTDEHKCISYLNNVAQDMKMITASG